MHSPFFIFPNSIVIVRLLLKSLKKVVCGENNVSFGSIFLYNMIFLGQFIFSISQDMLYLGEFCTWHLAL